MLPIPAVAQFSLTLDRAPVGRGQQRLCAPDGSIAVEQSLIQDLTYDGKEFSFSQRERDGVREDRTTAKRAEIWRPRK